MATPRQPREARSSTAQTRVRQLVWPGSRPMTLVRLVRVAQQPRRDRVDPRDTWGVRRASELGSVASHVLREVCADQRAVHDWLNPAVSRAAMDGSLAADFFSASISR